MKRLLIVVLIFIGFQSLFSQPISFVPRETVLVDTLNSEMIFYVDLTNISDVEQTVFLVRTVNNLPENWTSSLCFESCFPAWLDSVVTNGDFNSSPLAPNETREVALHVFPMSNAGTGYIQMQAGTLRNPDERITVDFTAIVNPTPAISFIPRETILTDTLNSEMIFYVDLKNISDVDQTVFLVRTLNNLPENWTSSLCFESCFPSWLDSVVTNGDFNSSPLAPNETREVALHVFPMVNPGTGYVQMQAGTLRNPDERITVNFTAIVDPTSVNNNDHIITDYYLSQNYPNPFSAKDKSTAGGNPYTKINFGLEKSGNVEIILYNILGVKVATLYSGYKEAGIHSISFDGNNLSSGIYFYTLNAGTFSQTRKMILEK